MQNNVLLLYSFSVISYTNKCLKFQEIKVLQREVDMKMYVYLSGPRLLDQFPFAREAVCAHVCACLCV